jgi:glycosyltransferase involved in cell wall biosynthesis
VVVSVIIPTKNRPEILGDALQTLLIQTHVPDQIIIVDQSSGDETRKVIDRVRLEAASSSSSKPELVYLCEPNLPGAGAARNLAIERSLGDILIFLDDDVLLENNFVKEILATYQCQPEVGGVSGVITNYALPSLANRLLMRAFWIGPFHDERQAIYWNADRLRDAPPFPVRRFGGGLMSVRRSALGGERFDDRYKGVGGEDVDLTWRLSERWPLVITPRARLFHIRTETGRTRDHWFAYQIRSQYYLYHRLWKKDLANRICFIWLNVGCLVVAALASLKQGSLGPWRTLFQGIKAAREQVKLSGIAWRA